MDFISLVPSTVLADQNSATYSCTLTNLWSANKHPVGYDSSVANSAHWSPPVLATHGEDYEIWAPKAMASPGVEGVAETGSTPRLQNEIEAAQADGIAGEFVIGNNQFNADDSPQIFEDIQLTPNFPFLSTISMVAPSPDWFTGIYNFSPVDEEPNTDNVVWYESFGIATYPWDAGTEVGDTYSINNSPQVPQLAISQLTPETVPENGILLDASGTEVLPMALWSCILQSTTPFVVSNDNDPPANNNINNNTPEEQEISIPVVPTTPENDEQEEELDIVAVIDGNPPIISPEEQIPPIVSEPQDENEIPVLDDEENPPPTRSPLIPDINVPPGPDFDVDVDVDVDVGDNNNENNNNGVCFRYFHACSEDAECCSGACERDRCRAQMRGPGRSESVRLSNQGGAALGGAAGRSRRSGNRMLLSYKKQSNLRRGFK